MALRVRRVMARAKARVIMVYIYSYGASWLILCLQLAVRWIRLVCDDKGVARGGSYEPPSDCGHGLCSLKL